MGFKVVLKNRKKVFTIVSMLALAVFLFFFLFQPVFYLFNTARTIKQDLYPIKQALERQDIATLKFELEYFNDQRLVHVERYSERLGIWQAVPFLGSYVSDFNAMVTLSRQGYDLAVKFLEDLEPVLPTVAFGGWGESGQHGGNIQAIAATLPVLSEKMPQYKNNLLAINQELSRIDPDRYPQEFKGYPVRSYLLTAQQALSFAANSFDDLVELLLATPDIIGSGDTRNYLIVIQDDRRLRPGGGHLVGYGAFEVSSGNFRIVKSGDMYFLDSNNKVRFHPPAPGFVRDYLGNKLLYIRDANYSPDFKTSSEQIIELWERTPGSFRLDGIVALDSQFLAAMIDAVGGVSISETETITGRTLDAKLEEFMASVGVRSQESRASKDLISVILNELLKKAFASGLRASSPLLQTMWEQAERKHLVVYLVSNKLQTLAEKHGVAGQIDDYGGDYLQLNQTDLSARQQRCVPLVLNKEVKFGLGESISQVTVEYVSSGSEGCRAVVMLLVPHGSALSSSDGFSGIVKTAAESGKTAFVGEISLGAGEDKTVTWEYKTPSSWTADTYQLLMQKQLGAADIKYLVKVGDTEERGVLKKDVELEL